MGKNDKGNKNDKLEEENSLDELKENLLNAANRISQVKLVTEYILQKREAITEEETLASKEIIREYNRIVSESSDFPAADIPAGSFQVYLSRLAKQPGTRITCPGRTQGYYLDQFVSKIEQIEAKDQENRESNEKNNQKEPLGTFQEKTLYPLLKNWLLEQDYDRVADISSYKKNGVWGNPDLVGLKIDDMYGKPVIEVTTIEAKVTDENWEKWIFEAVAHTRFSNRSYFAFMYPRNLTNKLYSTGMKLYAEHFKIGILIIEIPGENYIQIKEKKQANIDEESIRVIECHQAPYNETNVKFRKKFFESLDVLDLNNLYKFGESIDK